MENKTITFKDSDGLGIPNVTVISDIHGSQTTGSDGSVVFRPDKDQSFTLDETTAPPTEIAKVETNFVFKTIYS
ncbi:MAG: hypothetical protein IAE90_07515 [Ignavibacteria bacterium]|nr:hypothetical protein [Ignavibacteria bacterium]